MKDNVVTLKRSALNIDLKMFVRSHYTKIRKTLISGNLIHATMREKLHKRMKHCIRISRHIARTDTATYVYRLNSTKRYGDPLRDFLPAWYHCDESAYCQVEFNPSVNLVKPSTIIPIDSQLIVQ